LSVISNLWKNIKGGVSDAFKFGKDVVSVVGPTLFPGLNTAMTALKLKPFSNQSVGKGMTKKPSLGTRVGGTMLDILKKFNAESTGSKPSEKASAKSKSSGKQQPKTSKKKRADGSR
jgi:hypothetical protein